MDTQPSTPSPSEVLEWGHFRAWLAEQPDDRSFAMATGTRCCLGCYLRESGIGFVSVGIWSWRPTAHDDIDLPESFGTLIERLIDRGPDHWTARDACELADAISQEMQP